MVINGSKYDPLLQSFINKAGTESLSELEKSATNNFLKALRKKASIFDKLVWVHPYLGSTPLARSLNLLNTNIHKITFHGNVEHKDFYTQYNTGNGEVDISDIPSNTNMFFGIYILNSIQLKVVDIGQNNMGTNRQSFLAYWTGIGMVLDCGNVTDGRIIASPSAIDKFLIGNAYNSSISLWRDGVKLTSKTSNVAYPIPGLAYNADSSANTRQYAFSTMGKGLTDEEVVFLTGIVNNYMIGLGRSV